MPVSEKDRLAADVAERYAVFEEALFRDRRRYPLQELWEAGMRYAERTRSDPLNFDAPMNAGIVSSSSAFISGQ